MGRRSSDHYIDVWGADGGRRDCRIATVHEAHTWTRCYGEPDMGDYVTYVCSPDEPLAVACASEAVCELTSPKELHEPHAHQVDGIWEWCHGISLFGWPGQMEKSCVDCSHPGHAHRAGGCVLCGCGLVALPATQRGGY